MRMVESPAPGVRTIDRDYLLPTIDWYFGRYGDLRFDQIAITSVDGANKKASGTIGVLEVTAGYSGREPLVGEIWWASVARDNIYWLDDIARLASP